MVGAEWIGVYLRSWLTLAARVAYRVALLGVRITAAAHVITPEAAKRARVYVNRKAGRLTPGVPGAATAGTGIRTQEYGALLALRAPAHVLGEFRRCTIVLLSAEVWSEEICLRLVAQQTDVTDELDAIYRASFDRWAKRVEEEGSEAAGPPPEAPGHILSELPIALTDDVGTAYRPATRAAGGGGTQWLTEWRFVPGIPDASRRLTIALAGAGNQRLAYDIAVERGVRA